MNEKQKQLLIYGLIFFSALPFIFMVNAPNSFGFEAQQLKDLSLYLSAVFGYFGAVLIVWQLILGTRAIAGLYFEDLVSKLELHKNLGIYGTSFALLHPILAMYAYGESFFYTIVPNFQSEFELYVTIGRFAFIALLLIWVSSAIVKGKIKYRPWKYIHYLSYPVLVAVFLHTPEVGSSFADSRVLQVYWYVIVIVGIAGLALRLRHFFGFGKVGYRLEKKTQLSEYVWLLRLRSCDRKIKLKNGQYIYIQLSLWGEEHPFTVVDFDNDAGTIDIAYKEYGKFTSGLKNLEPGDLLNVDGPYGSFIDEGAGQEKGRVFIAGGIGVTPFIKSIIQPDDSKKYLFYANQDRESAVFRKVLKKVAQGPGLKYVDIFSREQDNHPEEFVEYGHIDHEVLKKYIDQDMATNELEYYICGPSSMVDDIKQILKNMAVGDEFIHVEKFGF